MKISSIVRALVAANASPEMILAAVEAAENEFSAEAESIRNADEVRKEQARARWHKWKETKGRNVSKRLQTLANDQQTTHASASPACSNTLSSEPKGSSEVKEEIKKNARATAPLVISDLDQFKAILIENGATESDISEWIKIRKAKRGPITGRAAMLLVEAAKECGITVSKAVDHCVSRNWLTVKPEWLAGSRNNGPPPRSPTKARTVSELATQILNGTADERDYQFTGFGKQNQPTRFDDFDEPHGHIAIAHQ